MSKRLFLSCVVSLAMFGGGYWLGKRDRVVPPAGAAASGQLSLPEIEDKIRELSANSGRNSDRELFKLSDSVTFADLPQTLAFIDKSAARNVRQGLRPMLVSRWAETDLDGARAYAQSIPNKMEREAALRAFVKSWANVDVLAAADWVKQFPPGQLRNQLVSLVSSALATKDPQAAFDLATSDTNSSL